MRRAFGPGALLLAAVLTLGAGCGTVPPGASASPSPGPVTAPATPTPGATVSPGGQSVTPSRTPVSPPQTPASPPSEPQPTATPAPPTATPTARDCSLPAALLDRDLPVVPGGARVVALTFDAGGSDAAVASILATLDDRDAPATFFLTGDFADDFPASARALAAAGPVGNHTQNHPDLTTLPAARVRAELRTAEATLRRVTGENPRPYFRFPLGAVDARTIRLVNAACYVPFRWSVDTLGWQGTKGRMTADRVYRRVLDGLRPGAIVLMHVGANPDDGTTLDADALPRVIDAIRERGYTLVTLERVLPAAP